MEDEDQGSSKEASFTLETDDIYLAAWFALAGAEYVSKRKRGVKVLFLFRHPTIHQLFEDFFTGKAQGKIADYAQKVVAFKELCFT